MSNGRVSAALDQAGLDYQITRHSNVGSLAEAAAQRGISTADLIKTLVIRRADNDYIFVLVPGGHEISWPKLRSALGVNRLSMPSAEVAFEVTGYRRGTITPFGSKTAWPVMVDASLRDAGSRRISLGAGERGVGVTVHAAAALKALGATFADITAPAPETGK